ncbi:MULTISPECIES: carbohydrate ABC transporter permease [Deefgea]|uniref:ABC transporter permease subunit n=1 Tax=Deefgea chitinilytica TaxID=570276 RepID=A0ABS2CDC5_9NEIS|nr:MULTISPECIES: sugar ABC transporter permease [Deefgea]MBM5572120.1 ABC transporter permease subunit [Deefgea chitinilytica]MBM9889355.1 sugar ABC transporter permease [Deefgea sp. CFH1-16]
MAKPGVKSYTAYLFILPFALPFLLFNLWPLLFNFYLSFMDYFIASRVTVWNSFANYIELIDNRYFAESFKNSLLFLITVPILQIGALGIALLLFRTIPGITFFRAGFYYPVIIAIPITGIVWNYFFAYQGILNGLLSAFDLLPDGRNIGWVTDSNVALYSVMLFFIWKNIGYYMVLYLIGLQRVPQDLLDAAKLDGANAWDSFWHVTLPTLRPIILLCSLLATIGALKVLVEVLVLTGGGYGTLTMLLFVYYTAFTGSTFGIAAAASTVILALCLMIAAILLKFLGEDGVWGKGC